MSQGSYGPTSLDYHTIYQIYCIPTAQPHRQAMDPEEGFDVEIINNPDFDDEDEPSQEELPSSPHRRAGHVSATISNGRYVVVWGGYTENARRNVPRARPEARELWVYDNVIEKWTMHPLNGECPEPMSGSCGVAVENNNGVFLYIYGGFLNHESSNELHKLNLITKEWEPVEVTGERPLKCDKMVGWEYENKLYFFGGFGFGPEPSLAAQRCDFTYANNDLGPGHAGWNNQLVMFDLNTDQWLWPETLGAKPRPRAAHGASKINNKVYIFGGRHLNMRLNDWWCLNLDSMVWEQMAWNCQDIPAGRSWATLTTLNECTVVLFGGYNQEHGALDDCWLLDVDKQSGLKHQGIRDSPRLWHTAALTNPGEILIIGGVINDILSDSQPQIHPRTVLTLRLTPKSLVRLCLDAVLTNKDTLKADTKYLPQYLQNLLLLKGG